MHTNGPEPGAREKVQERTTIYKTLDDLRDYMATATIKNPLLMIDDFKRVYKGDIYTMHDRPVVDDRIKAGVSQLVGKLFSLATEGKLVAPEVPVVMPKEPKTICVDFDLTIAHTEYPKIISIKPGAKEAMRAFRDMGYRIIISSCRSCFWNWDCYYMGQPVTPAKDRPVFKDMIAFLDAEGIVYDEIDDGTKGKVSAKYYIDDKGVRFDNNWDEIVAFIGRENK